MGGGWDMGLCCGGPSATVRRPDAIRLDQGREVLVILDLRQWASEGQEGLCEFRRQRAF